MTERSWARLAMMAFAWACLSRPAGAQQRASPEPPARERNADSLSAAERAFVASKLYSWVQLHFAHREGVPDLDLDRRYREYLAEALAATAGGAAADARPSS